MRNVCVAVGNWGEPTALEALQMHLFESPPLVAVHAAWALGRLDRGVGRKTLLAALETITNPTVKKAIHSALD